MKKRQNLNTCVITHNNILAPLDRTILTSGDYKNIDEILRDLKYDSEIYELVISKNSVITEGFFEVEPGDVINICIVPKGGGGGGKKIIGAVAMIALAVASAGAGAAWGAGVANALGVSAAAGTALVSTGIMVAGSMLLNAVMPRPNSSFQNSDFKASQTYSWNKATNQAAQGAVIPKIYGTHKITPPLIAGYIEAIDDKQYFNALYALNDGEIRGVSNITINSEPIENYKGVSYEVRNGANTQKIIEHFNDTPYDKTISKKLGADLSYALAQTDGNAVTSLETTLFMPRGLWHANDSGGLDGYTINVSVEYSADNKTWKHFSGSPISINSASTSSFRKTLKAQNLSPARYNVRAKFTSAPATGSRYGSDCYLEYLTEITKDDFIYPSTALLAIRALATDQLSGGAPTITAVVSANSDNPAEVCRQILKDSGVNEARISSNFNEWAKFCEDKKLKCNIVFDSEVSVKKALDSVSLLGRASVIQMGSKFDVIVERAQILPTQSFLFGMGNILSGTFKQSFLPLVDRANFIEITYYDKEKDYEPTIISVGSPALDNQRVANKSSVTLVGCTSEAQARAYGRFMLNCNRFLTQSIEFEAHIDSLVCRYGDIIKVSHDLPQYGFSGRLETDSENDVIAIDRNINEINPRLGVSYAVQIKNDINEVAEYQILDFIAPNKIRINLGGATYKKYDNYAIGEINKVSKLYRIVKISTGGEFTRQISAIEYNEDVYNDSESITTQNVSSLGLSNLRINEDLRLDRGNIKTFLSLAWRGASLSYCVNIKGGGKELNARVNDSFFEFEAIDDVSYEISISDSFGNNLLANHKAVGKLAPPPPVSNLSANQTKDSFELSWSYSDKPLDFKCFEIYKDGRLALTTTNLSASLKKDHLNAVVSVIAIDTSNIRSNETRLNLSSTLPPEVSAFGTIYKDNKLYAYWSEAGKGLYYELRKGASWDSAYKVADTNELTAGLNFSGSYLIKSYYENAHGLRVYSKNAKALIVDENRLDINVMETISQPAWDGTHANTKITNNGLCLNGDYSNQDASKRKLSALKGTYDIKKIVRLTSEKLCQINAFMDISGLALNSLFDAFANVDSVSNIDGANESDYSVNLLISTSKEGNVWSEFKEFKSGEYIGKAFKFRVALNAKTAFITPFISALNILVDMPDVIESDSGATISAPISVLYKNDFSIAPKVQITIINAQSGDDAILSNQTQKGFTIKIIDKNGNAVKREFNYIVKGY